MNGLLITSPTAFVFVLNILFFRQMFPSHRGFIYLFFILEGSGPLGRLLFTTIIAVLFVHFEFFVMMDVSMPHDAK